MDKETFIKQFGLLEKWINGGDTFKVNGALGFNVELVIDGDDVEFIFTEDDGGEATEQITLVPADVVAIHWSGYDDQCNVLCTDDQGYDFASFYNSKRSIPSDVEDPDYA